MASWWDRAAGMGSVCVWLGTWWCFNFIIKYEPINHDGFWNSHFLREVLSEKGNHEMNFHNSFLNNSNDFWDLIVRVWSDVGCTSWFWNHYLIWFCMNARASRGEAGRTFKSRMCTLIILQWQVGFSKNNPDDSLFPCKWASQREKQVSFGPSSAGERAKRTWQLWLFCGDRLEPPARWAWKWAWKQLNHLKKNNLDDWWFEYKFPCRVSFSSTGSSSARGNDFVQQWQVG